MKPPTPITSPTARRSVILAIQSASGTQSASVSNRYRPCAAATPTLRAAAEFAPPACRYRTLPPRPSRSANTALPFSTTMTSYASAGTVWSRSRSTRRRTRPSFLTATTTDANNAAAGVSVTELPAHRGDQTEGHVAWRRAPLAERNPVAAERLERLAGPHVREGLVHDVAHLALVGDLHQAARQRPAVRLDQRIEVRYPACFPHAVRVWPVDALGVVLVRVLPREEAAQHVHRVGLHHLRRVLVPQHRQHRGYHLVAELTDLRHGQQRSAGRVAVHVHQIDRRDAGVHTVRHQVGDLPEVAAGDHSHVVHPE